MTPFWIKRCATDSKQQQRAAVLAFAHYKTGNAEGHLCVPLQYLGGAA